MTVYKGGFGFMSMLTLIFVVAKIAGFINWSWLLVFAPLYAPLLIFSALIGLGGIVMFALDRK